jgi:polysaccharide export outer membrane protein
MRYCHLPVVLLGVLTLAACAQTHHTTWGPGYHAYASERRLLPPQVLQYRPESNPPSNVHVQAARATVPVLVAVPTVAKPVPVPTAQGGPYVPEPPYTLDTGDRLRIVVFGQQNLTNTYAVDASGKVAMPLIGPVTARGLTPESLAQAITKKLRNGFMREPSVSAEVALYRPFFILGEVTTAGQYPYVPHMTVETAVAIAGGYGPRGSKCDVYISRNVKGVNTRFEAPVTFPVRPGDTVTVQERWF